MKKEKKKKLLFNDHIGCFGDFKIDDRVCLKHCAVNVRCIIEQEQNTDLEIMDDLLSYGGTMIKVQ